MEVNSLLPIVLVIFSSWLLLLSLLFYWFVLRSKKVSKLLNEDQIVRAIEQLKVKQMEIVNSLKEIGAQNNTLDKRSINFLQKIGFTRFNPFEETGGDQSFAVALLDGKDDGFVLTSLHTRSGTRTYAKQVIGEKNKQGFSKEEQKVIKLAVGEDAIKHV